MKIGIICSPTYGGSGVVATELGSFLAQRGHEIHFICVAMPFRLDWNSYDRIFFHEVQTLSYPVLPGDLVTIAMASKAVQVATEYGLEIVHAHYAIPHTVSAWLAREVMGEKKFRLVTTLHGTDITLVGKAPSFYPVAKFAIENSDAVTTVSQWLKTETEQEFGIQRKIEVIPNFVDGQKFRKGLPGCKKSFFAPNGEKVLLHVSNFRPVKRIADVVNVFERVHREIPSKLLLIGDGPDRDMAEMLAKQLGISKHVHFLGKQEKIEVYFSCADLMLLPSEYESFGLAALEAMSAENVVIASNGGGLPEVIEHGIDGFLAPVGDVDKMAQYAIEILRDDARRATMGAKARENAIAKFNAQDVVAQYEKLYLGLLAE